MFFSILDLIFLQGLEVVFKVALVLLGNHKELIKQYDNLESIVEFLKTTLPEMGIIQMERVINQVIKLLMCRGIAVCLNIGDCFFRGRSIKTIQLT